MLQLVYVSSVSSGQQISLGNILMASRRNNTRDGITGLLYFNGKRFLQALEGSEEKVLGAMARISTDPRHRAVVVLSKREVTTREFGDWAMAHNDVVDGGSAAITKVAQLVANAAPDVKATFESFAKLSRAA